MWRKGIAEWRKKRKLFLSVVFSWDIAEAIERARFARAFENIDIVVGGPAVAYQPEKWKGIAHVGKDYAALPKHNPNATFTTRGCIRKCPWCVVPKIEGEFRELKRWSPQPIVCDNNFLAASKRHFNFVIDALKSTKEVDFNQGLDARLLTPHHANRLAELNLQKIRLSWDQIEEEVRVFDALTLLRQAGFPKYKISVYVLIGFNDTPATALYRLEKLRKMGYDPFPMRYQSPTASYRNEFVGKHWTHKELVRYMRYWSRLRYTRNIPFEEWEKQ